MHTKLDTKCSSMSDDLKKARAQADTAEKELKMQKITVEKVYAEK